MADAVAVAQLIARLEEADTGNCELSWAIAEYLGWAKFWCGLTIFVGPGEWADKVRRDPNSVSVTDLPGDIQAGQDFPAYTTSLDAALTLVPDGAVWHVQTDYGGLNRAKIGPAGRPSASIFNAAEREAFIKADAETPVLALCIAALKARQSPMPQPGCPETLAPNPNTDAAQES